MSDFWKVLIMVLAFLLLLVTIVTEIEANHQISDLGFLLIIMGTVSIVPAVAKYVYTWMIGENVSEEERDAVKQKRSNIVLSVSGVLALVFIVRLCMNIF